MHAPNEMLREEGATYESEKARMLAEGLAGKWVVYLGHVRLGIFDDPQVAHARGTEAAGFDRPFLMKRIGDDGALNLPALFLGLLHAGT